jgi:excisionase family DNA binding protein
MNNVDAPSPLLTMPETADRFRISEPTVRRLIRRGALPALRVGHRIRVDERELAAWLYAGSPISSLGTGDAESAPRVAGTTSPKVSDDAA